MTNFIILDALIKFADASSVTSILSNRNHTINGTHIVMRGYHQETNNSGSLPSLMSNFQQNQSSSNNTNGQKSAPYDQIMQENLTLKYEISNLQKSLAETQIYSKTAYDTFQALREKFGNKKNFLFSQIILSLFFLFKESEQALTNKLKLEYSEMVESYEARLKQFSGSSSVKPIERDRIKEEPIECDPQKANSANYLLEMQVMKDRLEQAQIDLGFLFPRSSIFLLIVDFLFLGKSQTENAILNAKLFSREQQSDVRFKELNSQYIRMKKQYDHISSCVKDFHSKLYQRKKFKTESKEEMMNTSDRENNDSNDDIIEVIMQIEPMVP